MSKYKTIEEGMQGRRMEARLARAEVLHPEAGAPLLPTPNLVLVKMAPKPQSYTNTFRSSLYQSSLKRLKQQKVTLLKDVAVPQFRQGSPFEVPEESIKRVLEHSREQKKYTFPAVNRLIDLQLKRSLTQLQKSEDKEQGKTEAESPKVVHSQGPVRRTSLDIDGATFIPRNLKEKYLEMRLLSLQGAKKSELLDKARYRRYQQGPELAPAVPIPRYVRKEVLQARVRGNKTILYPHQPGQHKLKEEDREQKKQIVTVRRHDLQRTRNQEPEEFFRPKRQNIHLNPEQLLPLGLSLTLGRHLFRPNNSEQERGDCSPWQTEVFSFDRF